MLGFVEYLILEDRERAERLLRQLHQIRRDRGATAGEEESAKARMAEIGKKYGLNPDHYKPAEHKPHTSSGPGHGWHWQHDDTFRKAWQAHHDARRKAEQGAKQQSSSSSSHSSSSGGFDWHAFKAKEKAEWDEKKKARAEKRKKRRQDKKEREAFWRRTGVRM